MPHHGAIVFSQPHFSSSAVGITEQWWRKGELGNIQRGLSKTGNKVFSEKQAQRNIVFKLLVPSAHVKSGKKYRKI